MINLEKLNPILASYKSRFASIWKNEKYKWEAIKHFQEHWDIDAADFSGMFKQATDKTSNLLTSGGYIQDLCLLQLYPLVYIPFYNENGGIPKETAEIVN